MKESQIGSTQHNTENVKNDSDCNATIKTPRIWKSLGSFLEVDLNIVKTSRLLIEVEVDIMIRRLHHVVTLDDWNMGTLVNHCVSLRPGHLKVINVTRKRVHSATQACPDLDYSVAQTNPALPFNIWTQYVYDVDVSKENENETMKQAVNTFLKGHTEEIESIAKYNGAFDLFKDDYPDLVRNEVKKTRVPENVAYSEGQCFADVKTCKNKLISCAAWHPSCKGVVAVSYVHQTRCEVETGESSFDEVHHDTFPSSVVLIWTVEDELKPKIVMKCSSEVYSLMFCSYNENIIAGGCMNGQVVFWDMKSKMEAKDISLASDIHGHHKLLHEVMGWMKPTKKLITIEPFTESSVRFSHCTCVIQVQWIHSTLKLNEQGRFEEIKNNEVCHQLMTCSEDGYLYIWNFSEDVSQLDSSLDLSKHGGKEGKLINSGDERHVYIHNKTFVKRQLKPLYKLQALNTKKSKMIIQSSMCFDSKKMLYDKLISDREKQLLPSKDNDYDSDEDEGPEFIPTLLLGTIEGEIAQGTWDGFESTNEKQTNIETLRLVIYGGIHDGPVTSITPSPFIENLILSVGGRIIAIWNNNIQDGPIFWKKSKFTLTSCSWSKSQPSQFYVSCSNGSIEVWDLLLRSDKPYFLQDVSGKIITGLYPQKVDNINNVLGVADYNGSFQTYLTPAYTALETEKYVSRTVRLVNKQTEHLMMLVVWHNEWRESHSEYLILKKQMINEELRKREVVMKAKKRQILERKKLEEENQRLRRSKVSLLSKEAHSTQRWLVSQESYMKQIIIAKKNLCREELLQKQEPLIKLKRQEEEKKQKEQHILTEKSSLVEKLTADLLPEIESNEKYYTMTDERVTLKDFQENEILKQFKKYEVIGLEFVNSNQFEYNIDWISLLLNGKKIRCSSPTSKK